VAFETFIRENGTDMKIITDRFRQGIAFIAMHAGNPGDPNGKEY
jgi:hypothetical protein